jgi:tripartite-type tricarboxylate transporter receptor subunit TctC
LIWLSFSVVASELLACRMEFDRIGPYKDVFMLRLDHVSSLALCIFGVLPTLATAQISDSCKSALTGQRLTVIVANAAGGGYDTYARALAPVLDAVAGLQSTVVNMPAAGGLVALTTLADSGPDELVVMVENGTDVLRAEVQDGGAAWSERVQQLGVFHAEPSAWVGKPDLVFADTENLVAASSSADGIVEFGFGGQATGKEIKLISGYDGSKETEAALLRGEADLMSASLTTSLKSAKSGDLAVHLLLSDKASDRAPGVPHIAGEDGLAAMLAKDLPEEERARRIELAGLVADLSYDVRTVLAHSTMRQDLRDCLTEAVADAIRDPAFAEAAEAQGRPVTPMDPAEAADMLASQMVSVAKLAEMAPAQ